MSRLGNVRAIPVLPVTTVHLRRNLSLKLNGSTQDTVKTFCGNFEWSAATRMVGRARALVRRKSQPLSNHKSVQSLPQQARSQSNFSVS